MKLHILGASGAGVTTVGWALAARHGLLHLDSDDYYWQQTDPPFTTINPIEVRWRLLNAAIGNADNWLISGSMHSWCEPYVDLFDAVIYLDVATEIRISRLRERERRQFRDRILPGGDMHVNHQEFIRWAAQYDEGFLSGRSRPRHERWLKQLRCPIIRIVGDYPVDETVRRIDEALETILPTLLW